MTIIEALELVITNIKENADRQPRLGTLLEEIAEYCRSIEGRHEDPPGLELVQIAGIAINMLKAYDYAEVISAFIARNARKNFIGD